MNKEMDAVYILSPLPHIVDCLMADFERRWYRRAFVIWTSGLSFLPAMAVKAHYTQSLTLFNGQSCLEISARDWNKRRSLENSSLSSEF